MARLDWVEAYATGNPVLDYEHRALIGIINSSCEALRAADEPAAVSDCLASLYEHACAHFALEEKLMREARYASYAAHKDGHEKLVGTLRDMMDSYEEGKCRNCRRALDECLVDWFDGHFRVEDGRLQNLQRGT